MEYNVNTFHMYKRMCSKEHINKITKLSKHRTKGEEAYSNLYKTEQMLTKRRIQKILRATS